MTMKPAEPREATVRTGSTGLLSVERRDQLVDWYRQMLLIRRFEEAAAEMYTRAKIGGYLHLNVGEEATVVGAIAALQPQDYIFSNYREHGHALARGVSADRIMAELFGKATGVSGGRGGSMHLFDASKRFLGGYGIVGGAMPLSVGAALAVQYEQTDAIVVSVFGDGATNIGAFHESLNLAQLWHLPLVFVCVNNHYAMGKPIAEESAVTEMWRKACAYNMAAEQVDGMDILAVYATLSRAAERARQEQEPTLVEAVTYRYRGHSMADAGAGYRTTEEIERWRQRDPLVTFKAQLDEAGLLRGEDAQEIAQGVDDAVARAVRFAEESPFPALSTLYEDVYGPPSTDEETHG